ncbi:hypothetical protein IFM89_034287 [Coptis chinensis]|uniref:Cytochrome P450 n=1 Tax=Coptis chinensis TaxID=261450 RepID=A0A835IG86_9MAGN|nr:hypothetical protein IFM89_034287 [Coptis chinensis]
MRSESSSWLDEYGIVAFTLSTILLLITLCKWKTKKHRNGVPPLPPGPRGLPLVGYLPFLEPDLNPHFARLAKIYGPIFTLKLGTRLCIVLSSPSVAKEVLKDHDATCANHDAPAVGITCSYGGVSLVCSHYGEHWRMLRKVCVTQLLSNKRLESLYQIRQRECRQMVNNIRAMIGIPITIDDYINATLFDTVTGMLWGGLAHEGHEKKQINSEFRKLSQRILALCGEPNISDFIPFLAMFDLQRKEREMKMLMSWFDRILDQVIEQRLTMKTVKQIDFLQVLLQCRDQVDQKKTPMTMTHIKALFMVRTSYYHLHYSTYAFFGYN